MKAIKAVSDYMAFLAAVRPEMLPGLKLRSLHQATRQALDILWKSERRLTSTTGDEKVLVDILKEKNETDVLLLVHSVVLLMCWLSCQARSDHAIV